MQKKRTTDLFRFVTLRTPQLLTTNRRALGFIEHPDHAQSHFLQLISASDDLSTNRTAIQAGVATFTPYETVEEIKNLSIEFWDFALWLSDNKNKLVRADIDALIPTNLPTTQDIYDLWDNLFYDVLEEKNPYIRQACLQALVAQNFIDNYATYSPGVDPLLEEEELKLITRLANGKVIIHAALTAEPDLSNSDITGNGTIHTTTQAQMHKSLLSGLSRPILERVRDELKSLENTYTNEFNVSFDAALKTYETTVENAVAQYLADNPKVAEEEVDIDRVKVSETDVSGEKIHVTETTEVSELLDLENQLPSDLVDEFVFSFNAPLSTTYTSGKVSEETETFIDKNLLREAPIDDAINCVEAELAHKSKLAAQVKRKKYKDILVNGIPVRHNPLSPKDFSLSFHKESVSGEKKESDDDEVFFSMETGYNGAFFTQSTIEIIVEGTTYTIESPKILSNSDGVIFAKFKAETLLQLPECVEFEMNATFTLDNGDSYKINKRGYWNESIIAGFAFPDIATEVDIELYGVTPIGVADFRRVEQELCCYVPGEVSHVENILAREYKEKETRRLHRSELTTELSQERESEEQTDTTSTARHEMSTEISEVINRDRNRSFGFSSTTSGDIPLIAEGGVNITSNFSFGQSTSDSNAQARNYAEDLTRRALERLVQRTTLRRTSTIIKEFEENNRHGFDNRERTDHVTGVYRWIDKLYKNRIVNYRKRLMYEFLVPEPARFYKEAIIIKAEEENLTTTNVASPAAPIVAIKPTHPSEHGLEDASSLTRENYQSIAAIYNAVVISPQDEFSNLSSTYAESIGTTDNPKAFSYNDLTVEQDYECFHVSGVVRYNFKALACGISKAHIKINAASRTWERSGLCGQGDLVGVFAHSLSNITGSVPVSVNTKKITAFNLAVEAKCRLKASVYEAWQQDVYAEIMRAYEDQLREYNQAMEIANEQTAIESEPAEDTTVMHNQKFNLQIVQTELKRICIELLTRPFGIEQGRNFYTEGKCEVPELKLSKRLDLYGSRVKFLEQAFDWELMANMFYPYYWADRCDWKALFQSQAANDNIFQAFLQSGMGRVVVPVREGFEDAVSFFMETGQVWNGTGIIVDTDDELYLSIADEMTTLEGEIEGEWETLVPSTLTIVQARSALLDEEGLPCCETDAQVLAELNLLASTNVLSPRPDPV